MTDIKTDALNVVNKQESWIKTNAKALIIGAVVGAIIGFLVAHI